jgi:hypothetical protein
LGEQNPAHDVIILFITDHEGIVLLLALLPAVFFGWTLGRNDSVNIYGTTVTSGILK